MQAKLLSKGLELCLAIEGARMQRQAMMGLRTKGGVRMGRQAINGLRAGAPVGRQGGKLPLGGGLRRGVSGRLGTTGRLRGREAGRQLLGRGREAAGLQLLGRLLRT